MSDPLIFLPGKELAARASEKVPWVLEPFGVAGSVCMLYGRQGIGKSRLLLQLAHALATGTSWLGFPVHEPGTVAYINLDMPTKEFDKMWAEGEKIGLVVEGMWGTSEQAHFNLFDPKDRGLILASVEELGAKHVLVDTGPRCYRPHTGADINDEVRRLIGYFQQITPEGLLAFSHHDKKPGTYQKADDVEVDDNAFSGPAAWESAITTSWRVTERSAKVTFWIKKHRLAAPDAASFTIQRDPSSGFFRVAHDYQFDLRTWPRMVPLDVRFQPSSKMDIFRDVAARHRVEVDTVRRYYTRTRGQTAYPWDIWDMGHPVEKHVPDLNGDEIST